MFEQATKEGTYLRAALFGPSGGGKTMSALRMATGLGGTIAFIDTERRSARKYSDRFAFKVCDLENRTIAGYVEAIREAMKLNANVLIVDSMSHAWDELLADVDRIARAKYSGNKFGAWSEGTPKQNQLIDVILSYPGHLIATMRSDTEWTTEKDDRGKVKPVKVGLKPRQGKGIEFEFDMLLEISAEHVATVTKDRTGKFQDQTIECPDEKFGEQLAAWLSEGVPKLDAERPKVKELNALIDQHNISDATTMEWMLKFTVRSLSKIKDADLDRIIAAVKKKYQAEPTAA